MSEVIPAEAVEAAVKAHIGPGDTAWDDLTPMVRRVRIRKMQKALEAAAPYMQAGAVEACDAELDLHLIIKDLRVRNGSAARMMVCSSEDRAQIVQAILAAGYHKARE